MLNTGQPEKTDFFVLYIDFCPGPSKIIRSCILGKTKTSLTKYSNSYWFLHKTGLNNPERHSGTIKVPLALQRFMCLITLGIKQVGRISLAPTLNQGVYCFRTYTSISAIKPNQLVVVMRSKAINSKRTPFGI